MELEAQDGLVAFEVVAAVHHLDGRRVAGSADVAEEDAPVLTVHDREGVFNPPRLLNFKDCFFQTIEFLEVA
jgi:hypothetical protein